MKLVTLNEKEYRSFTDKMNTHFLESYEWGELSLKRGFTPNSTVKFSIDIMCISFSTMYVLFPL